ncbi:HAD family hydrolase [Corallococcus llansteffanensis]|uniref:HAD family hydrolase n=2 Tax=Corallococcus llansteffanensis TaxID=2316731 RepID=A0A3A8Q3H6_9BACT|nr:HAD family hydrolase [Corallococcus llansteffanensis]
MGNASAEVQRLARHVTRTNDEDGFAYAVDAFILGQPPRARTKLGLPPRARACLFGLDGVLAQTSSLHARAWKQLCDYYLRQRAQASGQPFIPFDLVRDYSRYFDGKPPLEGLHAFLDSRGIVLQESTVHALNDRKTGLLVELLRQERVETYEGTVRYVQAARAAGLRTAVVSGSRHCAEMLQSAGISDLFDARLDATPPPEVYLAAARALGVDSEEAVIFEDTPDGVATARAAHFAYVIGVDRLGRSAELRRHGADLVVTDPAALLEQDGARDEAP